jgi:hypothetical protein
VFLLETGYVCYPLTDRAYVTDIAFSVVLKYRVD